MVADPAFLVRFPKLQIPFGESRQRHRVLGAQGAVNRRPGPKYSIKERIILPDRWLHIERRHGLVKRGPDNIPLPIQDGEGLRQCLLVELDRAQGTGGVGQGGEACYPVEVRLGVPRTERLGTKRIGVACLHEPRGRMLGRPEVAGLRLPAGETRAYHPRHLQELLHRQVRREDSTVSTAAVGLGLREIHEWQRLRQGL